eukprot:m.284616 g.284616  ORF g.284616 m.284616 type:complete len:348 (+) comp15766_c0_seq3:152-1195(+)
MSVVCPVCLPSRELRPRDPGQVLQSFKQHCKSRGRQGCQQHRAMTQRLFAHAGPAQCFACDYTHPNWDQVIYHIGQRHGQAVQAAVPAGAAVHDGGRRRRQFNVVRGAQGGAQRRRDEELRAQQSTFYHNCKIGLAREVQRMLAEGLDPNLGGEDGYTPLMTACEAGHTAVVTALLQSPRLNVNRANSYGQTALMFAAQGGHEATVLEMMRCPRIIIGQHSGRYTAAELARMAGHDRIADQLSALDESNQVRAIVDGVMGTYGVKFDSLAQRVEHVTRQLPLPQVADEDMPFEVPHACCVCLSESGTVALLPCFHSCFCEGCAASLPCHTPCPVCRTSIDRKQKLFF